ncbi:MAG: diguanylate cyclase [Gammaproteobacteria bacterium]|nr:diguanylate cyclase [Gammaproteobacteria bacterium]MBU1776124.1 diguanylate cyclase [Gammaproteobacteria bacterium]MBU1968673.1 diguanylate cyclase [Gammaproteobacteria bacterium]
MYENLTAFANRLRQEIGLRLPFLIPKKRDGTYAYLLTIVLMGVALLVRLAIAPVSAGLQYLTFFPSVALSAIFGGYKSGLLATAIGLVLATYIFTPPYYSISMEVLRLSFWSNMVFLLDGIIVSVSIEAMHRYRRQLKKEFDESRQSEAQVRKLNEELEKQIARRIQADQDLAEQEEFFRLIAENVEDFIAVLDLNGRRIYNSPSYSRLFGDVQSLKGTDSFAEIHPDDRDRVRQIFSNALQRGIGQRTEYRFVLPNGGISHMESSSGVIKNSQGEPQSVVVVSHDVTERKMAEQKIEKFAFYDTLTQLPNRRLLDDRLEQAIAACKRSGRYGAVLFLDLDNFKPLNDKYGHKIGDVFLAEVARRLTRCVREVDTVARFGGDEFVVVLNDLAGNEPECVKEARIVAEKIHVALSGPYLLTPELTGTRKMITHQNVGASIGVALFGKDASAENILKWADKAMYRAKEAGRNQCCFHDSGS